MLTAEQVAEFLRQNPGFFENHVDILMNLQIPHPHGGRAVSIGERQLVAVREKSRLLEDKLRELIQFGEENDAVGEKVHRLACRLIEAPEPRRRARHALPRPPRPLRRAARRGAPVARGRGESRHQGVRARSPPEMREFVEQMTAPYCGHHAVYESQAWFGEAAPHLKSFALVALKRDDLHLRRGRARLRGPEALLSRDGHALPRAHRRAGEPCAVALRDPRP